MIIKGTKLFSLDNSGSRKVECIHVYGHNSKKAFHGDLLAVSVKKLKHNVPKKRVKKGQIVLGLVLSTRFKTSRSGGTFFRGIHNAVTLLDKGMAPLCNRLSMVAPYELKKKGFDKIVAISRGLI